MGNFIFLKVPAYIDFLPILCLFWRLAMELGCYILAKVT